MCGTRSPLRPAQAIELEGKPPALLIAAHGGIGGGAQNRALFALTRAVRARLGGLPVACGVLNGEPSLDAAMAGLAGDRAVVYPLFMGGGHYVENVLPMRLGGAKGGDAGGREVTILPPLGLDPALATLIGRRVRDAAPAAPRTVAGTAILVIAHGSAITPQSCLAAEAFAEALHRYLNKGPVRTAYLEQAPFAADAAAALGAHSVVISFFTGEGSHGGEDVPKLLVKAGKGCVPVIGPVGADPKIADLVVAAVRRELTGELSAA